MPVSYPKSNAVGYDEALLALSSLDNETILGADEHQKMIDYVFSTFKKSLGIVVAIVGDNISTNKGLALKASCRFVDHVSHRFNLSVKYIISKNEKVIEIVHELMSKITDVLPVAKLRALTPLKLFLDSDTRSSSTYHVFVRYNRSRGYIHQIDDKDISRFLPSRSDDLKIHSRVERLNNLD